MNGLSHRLLVTALPVLLAAGNELWVELSGTGDLSWRLIAKAGIASALIGVVSLYRWLFDPSEPPPPLPALDPRFIESPGARDPRHL